MTVALLSCSKLKSFIEKVEGKSGCNDRWKEHCLHLCVSIPVEEVAVRGEEGHS